MKNKIHLKDESGDKKYFTQIPNMIVNHSTAYEQSLYLVMKRIAGEGGNCYASLNTLSNKMGVHRITVSQTIKKLLKRKWIEETESKKVRGGKVRQFIIIDLWPRNIKEYENTESASQVASNGSESQITESESQITRSESQVDTPNIYNKNNNKNIAIVPIAGNFNPLIELFKEVNPSYKTLFGNKTQRACLKRMLKEHGEEKLRATIEILPRINRIPYMTPSTTPYELEKNLGKIQAKIEQEQSKGESKKLTLIQ